MWDQFPQSSRTWAAPAPCALCCCLSAAAQLYGFLCPLSYYTPPARCLRRCWRYGALGTTELLSPFSAVCSWAGADRENADCAVQPDWACSSRPRGYCCGCADYAIHLGRGKQPQQSRRGLCTLERESELQRCCGLLRQPARVFPRRGVATPSSECRGLKERSAA